MKSPWGGPPKSGKSCLRDRLKVLLRNSGYYPYFLTVNPDGEGAWFQETAETDADLAQRLKAVNKQKWSDEHAPVYAEWVRNISLPLTLIDLGGRLSHRHFLDNRQIGTGDTEPAVLVA